MGNTKSREQININENFNDSTKNEKFSLGNLTLVIVISTIVLTAIILYLLKKVNNYIKEYVNKKINRIHVTTV